MEGATIGTSARVCRSRTVLLPEKKSSQLVVALAPRFSRPCWRVFCVRPPSNPFQPLPTPSNPFQPLPTPSNHVLKSVNIYGLNSMGLLNSIGAAMKKQWCSYDFADFALAGLIAGAPLIATPVVGDELAVSTAVTTALTRVRNASDPWCNKTSQSPLPSPATPPFQGGQCEGRAYYLEILIAYIDQSLTFNTSGISIVGKISAIEGYLDLNGCFNIRITHAGGIFESGAIRCNVGGEIISTTTKYIAPSGYVFVESEAESCGNPPSPPSPIPPLPELDDIIDIPLLDDDGNPELDDDGNPKFLPDIPIKFFPPCFGGDGIAIPFEVSSPVGKVCGKANIAFDGTFRPSIDTYLCPEARKAIRDDILAPAAQAQSTDSIGSFFDLDDPIGGEISSDFDGILSENLDIPDKPIMGVFIFSKNKNKNYSQTIILRKDESQPDILIPRIGNIRFEYLIQISESEYKSAFSEEIPIKASQQFIPCPSPHGAIAVSVEMDAQWDCRYQVARRKSCCESCGNIDPNELPPIDENDRCA